MLATALLAAGLSYNAARAIAIAPRERPSWALLELPQAIDPGASQTYGDLRIVDDRGRQTPYVLDPHCAAIPTHNAAISDLGFVPGRYTEAILDAGTSGELYAGVSLTTSRDTFFERADVAISDDRATWREVATGALIYRVGSSADPGTQTIAIFPARARWIRIRVRDPKASFPIDTASLDGTESAAPEAMRRLDAQTSEREDDDRHLTILTLDLGEPNTRVASLGFTTSQPEFSRSVTVSRSDDGENWEFAGEGDIERFAQGSPTLEVPLSGGSGRYVRAEIVNGDDEPLEDLGVTAYGPRRALVFVAAPHRSYSLQRVNGAQAPVYDLSALIEHDNPRHFLSAELAESTAVRSSSPVVTVSQPLVISIAFGIAIALLGAVTLLTLKPRSPS
ncbi:MAG TPA: hypothetical protein VGG89_08665 [Candidatus Baltobacteraceae bacterium]|jgi:hypothetical protein